MLIFKTCLVPLFFLGDYEAAISEHRQELALSEVLNDVIGTAVANRKIGECYAEMGNFPAALKVSTGNCKYTYLWTWVYDIPPSPFSTSDVTLTWLALSKIMLRSKGPSPPLVGPTCSVMNRTSREEV